MKKVLKNPFERVQRGAVITLCAYCVVFIAILLIGCKKENDHILLTILDSPNYSIQFGEKPDKIEIISFIVAKENGSTEEMNLNPHAIERFTYEKGYEYILKVKKTLNEESPYSLIEIVLKNQTGELETVVLLNVTTESVDFGMPYKRVIVKEENEESLWQPTSFQIDGFEYDEEFDYLLKVKKTIITMPPMSGMRFFNLYTLIEIVSKTPKKQ
jgi:hypothetical protein